MTAIAEKNTAVVRYRIGEARKTAHIPQGALAERLEITQSYLSDIERGKYNPSPELFARICLELNRQPGDLIFIDTGEVK